MTAVNAARMMRLLASMLLLVAHLSFLSSQPVPVSSSTEFFLALNTSTVTDILVVTSLSLQRRDANRLQISLPIVVRDRNVTIVGQGPDYPRVNFNYLLRMVSVYNGSQVAFKHITSERRRYGVGYGFDFFVGSAGGVVLMEDVIATPQVCRPYNPARVAETAVPDGFPPDYNNNSVVVDEICLANTCYHNVFWMKTYAEYMFSSSDDGDDTGTYVMQHVNVYRVCTVFIDEQCAAQREADACAISIITSINRAAARAHIIRVAVPAAVCGFVVLLAIVLAVCWLYCRRRRQRQKQLQDSKKLPGGEGNRADSFAFHSQDGMLLQMAANRKGQQQYGQNQIFSGCTKDGQHFCMQLHATLLGAGSYGQVYQGEWNGQPAAIKVIKHDATTLKRVQDEMNLHMNFSHDNVVRALHCMFRGVSAASQSPAQKQLSASQAGSQQSPPLDSSPELQPVRITVPTFMEVMETWIIQELCDQGSLTAAISRQEFHRNERPWMHPILLRLLDVACGMAYIHSKRVCHGDLKCSNVLLSSHPADRFGRTAKVADFGLSRALIEHQTHLSTKATGTVSHMPPELLKNGKLAMPADVFAFGVVMWEIVTGAKPYAGMYFGEVVDFVVRQNRRLRFPGCVPAPYVQLAEQCWRAQPYERPTFGAIMQALTEMLLSVEQLQAFVDASQDIQLPSINQENAEGTEDAIQAAAWMRESSGSSSKTATRQPHSTSGASNPSRTSSPPYSSKSPSRLVNGISSPSERHPAPVSHVHAATGHGPMLSGSSSQLVSSSIEASIPMLDAAMHESHTLVSPDVSGDQHDRPLQRSTNSMPTQTSGQSKGYTIVSTPMQAGSHAVHGTGIPEQVEIQADGRGMPTLNGGSSMLLKLSHMNGTAIHGNKIANTYPRPEMSTGVPDHAHHSVTPAPPAHLAYTKQSEPAAMNGNLDSSPSAESISEVLITVDTGGVEVAGVPLSN